MRKEKDYCRWEFIGGERVFIPGCIGAAANHGCTCHTSMDIDDRIELLEKELRYLKRLKKQGATRPPEDEIEN